MAAEDERLRTALRDLAEFGWIHVQGASWAARIAAVAMATTGRRFRVRRLAGPGDWYCVEEVPERDGEA